MIEPKNYARINTIYKFVDNEWWYYYPQKGKSFKSGKRERAIVHKTRMNKRMYVNGKYISTSHPLYKAGKYKSFDDAAFSSLINYNRNLKGEVYIISNHAFKGWVKVGMAVDSKDRLKNYQTSLCSADFDSSFCSSC